jgi:DNA-directed RNA polymerase specialized sigma24 family protein
MNLLRTNLNKPSIADDYATSDDFRKLFTEGMVGLYLLSYLLTGNREKAEQCFVGGLEDCVKSNSVFKEWAHSWARRAIVQNAIRMMSPRPNHAAWTIACPDPSDKLQSTQEKYAAIATVLALGDFERFVFVLSVLERFSDQECSVVLSCSREEVGEARMRALQQIPEIHHRNGASGG